MDSSAFSGKGGLSGLVEMVGSLLLLIPLLAVLLVASLSVHLIGYAENRSLIEACEKDLPRTKECVVKKVAVEKTNEKTKHTPGEM